MLISEAGAANNYRTPIHHVNPLTSEACPEPFGCAQGKLCRRDEVWATIAQATVDDACVPHNYPKD